MPPLTSLQRQLLQTYAVAPDNMPNKYSGRGFIPEAADSARQFQTVKNALETAQNISNLYDENVARKLNTALDLILSGQIKLDQQLEMYLINLLKELHKVNDPYLSQIKEKVSMYAKRKYES